LYAVCAAAVPRVWKHSRAGHGFWSMTAVTAARIAYENRLLLHIVSTLARGAALVDGVLVVETLADRVPFDNLITHDDGVCGGG
jgi:hypothetical protein